MLTPRCSQPRLARVVSVVVLHFELGGWDGSSTSDSNPGQFSALHGETYNCPAKVAEARYSVTVDYLSFYDEDGGAGFHRGGKGVRIDYRIKPDNPSTGSGHRAWLTVAYIRDKVPPWPLKGGQPGSPNHILIRRANGETERHAVVTGGYWSQRACDRGGGLCRAGRVLVRDQRRHPCRPTRGRTPG